MAANDALADVHCDELELSDARADTDTDAQTVTLAHCEDDEVGASELLMEPDPLLLDSRLGVVAGEPLADTDTESLLLVDAQGVGSCDTLSVSVAKANADAELRALTLASEGETTDVALPHKDADWLLLDTIVKEAVGSADADTLLETDAHELRLRDDLVLSDTLADNDSAADMLRVTLNDGDGAGDGVSM